MHALTAGHLSRRQVLLAGVSAAGLAIPILVACGSPASASTAPGTAAPAATAGPTAAPAVATAPSAATAATSAPAVAVPTTAPTVAVAAPAASPTAAPVPQNNADTLIEVVGADLGNMDPAQWYGLGTTTLMYGVYETLVRYKLPGSDFEPVLAESWDKNTDATQWTFKLRQNVKFHDGTPFNAAAAKYAIERGGALKFGPSYMTSKYIASIETPDDYTLRLLMKDPSPTYLHYLAGQWSLDKMVSPTALKANEAKDDKGNPDWGHAWLIKGNAVGTGPYRLTRYLDKQFIELDWNPDWWGGSRAKQPAKVILRTMPNAAASRLALQKGEVDIVTQGLAPEDFDALSKDPNVTVKGFPAVNLWCAVINMSQADNPALKSAKFRQALSYAFPYDQVIGGLLRGRASRLGPIPPGFEGYDQGLKLYSYDLTKAKSLLQEAGVDTRGPLRWRVVSTDDFGKNVAQLYQASLQQIGLKLDIMVVQPSQKVPEDVWKQVTFFWSLGIPDNFDPYGATWIWWASDGDNVNMSLQGGHYDNPTVNKLLAQAKVEPDATKRAGFYRDAGSIVYNDAIWLWVSVQQEVWAFRNVLQNVQGNGEYTAGGCIAQTVTKA